jgi:hypothetical protein
MGTSCSCLTTAPSSAPSSHHHDASTSPNSKPVDGAHRHPIHTIGGSQEAYEAHPAAASTTHSASVVSCNPLVASPIFQEADDVVSTHPAPTTSAAVHRVFSLNAILQESAEKEREDRRLRRHERPDAMNGKMHAAAATAANSFD